ncbi:MAG TPA: site-2 protease family protein [Rubrobacteraceae bacterium]|nr:site-2 protease family protein [Rubrobacteraceae bacterium]
MRRFEYLDEGDRDGPVFRSDVEGRPEAPAYEPLRPEGGPWSVVKKLLAPLAAVGLWLATFKGFALLLLKVKFLGTALTMVVSIGAYALLFPVWFAVGFVVLIWVHEMGHVLQLRREGIEASAPMFIPFLGAFVAMKQMPKDVLAEARVGLAGPILGSLGALGAWGIYEITQEPLFLGLAYVGFFLNLFNLLPMLPLDGGRAVGALSPVFWIVGVLGVVGLLFVNPNPILIFIAILGGMELWRRWRTRKTPEGKSYYAVDPKNRLLVGLVYFGLIALLALGMAATFVPDPTVLR